MKSKTLKRVRLAIARHQNENEIEAKCLRNQSEARYWRDQVRFWRETPRFGVWNEQQCSRLAGEAEKAARYFENGAVGPFPNINMGVEA